MKKITILLLSVFFLMGCTPETLESYKLRFEEEIFEGMTTPEEKLEVLTHEFVDNLFSIDKNDNHLALEKIRLYSSDSYFEEFEEVTYPHLLSFDERVILNTEFVDIREGLLILNETDPPVEINAYEVKNLITYRQNGQVLIKEFTVIYKVDGDDIKIIETLEGEVIADEMVQ